MQQVQQQVQSFIQHCIIAREQVLIRKYNKTQGSNKNDVGKMPKEPDPSFKLEARIGKARNTHMMVVHIFNHVRVNETPKDL